MKILTWLFSLGTAALSFSAIGQSVVSFTGTPLVQNFDSMGTAGTVTVPGWFFGTAAAGNGAITRTNALLVSAGTASVTTNYNAGAAGGADRAFGSQAGTAAGGDLNMEVRIRNNTGFQSITAINVTYDGEQWRNNNNATAQTLTMRYSTDGVTFTAMPAMFTFTSPINTTTAAALDGNLPANRVAGIGGSYTLPASVPPGGTIYLRWLDVNDSGNDHILAIDNFSFSATLVTDPTTITILTPTNGQQVVKSAILNVTTLTTGNITNVDFEIDGAFYLRDATAPYGGAFPTTDPQFTVGSHTIRAIAFDATGATTPSAISNFTVLANSAPFLLITNTFTTNLVNGRINNGPYLVGSFVTVQATNFDDVAVTNVDWYVDGALYVRRAGASTGFTYNDSLSGSHTIYGIASDAGGLTMQSATVGISVTNPSPNFVVLVPNGSTWQTFSGGVAPPLDGINFAWYRTGYDTAGAWSNLVAEIGEGDRADGYPETSHVDIGPGTARYRAVWFRKEFNVVSPGQYQNFRLNLLRDDGAVVFINDVPVWTNNMALPLGETLLFPNDFSTNLAAIAAPDEGLVYQTFNLDPLDYPNLAAGNWTVAVEVHQNSATSSDLSFDFMLWGEFATLPTLAITSPTNNQAFRQGDSTTVNVSVSTFVTNAIVKLDNVVQGSDDVLPFSVVVSNLTVGMHTLVAQGTDSFGNPGVSAPITINVTPNLPPTVVVTNLIDGTNLLVGGFIANVGASAADDASVARVEFYDNGALRATDTTSPYAAALMVDFTVGTHFITARAYDGAGLFTDSAPITVNVTNPPALTAVLTNRADWRYLVPDADVPNWFTSGFADGSWAVGPAKFGFGGDGETTVLARTNITTGATNVGFYFRKQLSLTAPQLASFGGIPLWLNRDDGAVVYVNGAEVYRVKMTTNNPVVPYNALADAPAVGGTDENTFFVATNLPTSVFSAGVNTIAVEVHQDTPASSDISFDLMLWGSVAAGPTLTIVLNLDGSVTVSWNGGGTLISSNDPSTPRATWTTVAGASPVTFTAGSLATHRFYAVRVP
jgi:hypothetical protein